MGFARGSACSRENDARARTCSRRSCVDFARLEGDETGKADIAETRKTQREFNPCNDVFGLVEPLQRISNRQRFEVVGYEDHVDKTTRQQCQKL